MFKTIEKNCTAEIVEKKSKFIANIYYVESVQEAEELIKQINKKYFDARHNCYAFCICTKNGKVNRFSDDGEPSGTAGGPMLNILTSQNLENVLVIVTRYFGGILLGTGGLVKAYSEVTIEALKSVNIIQKELGNEARVIVNYCDLDKLRYYFKQNNIAISNIEYAENVSIFIDITDKKLEIIFMQKENLKILNIEIIKKKFIVVKK